MNTEDLIRSQYFADITGIVVEVQGEQVPADNDLKKEWHFKFSVPEFYSDDIVSCGEPVKRDEVIKQYRDDLKKYIASLWKGQGWEDDFIEEAMGYVKFFCRVRKGETWTKEMGDKAVAETTAKLKAAVEKAKQESTYEEI